MKASDFFRAERERIYRDTEVCQKAANHIRDVAVPSDHLDRQKSAALRYLEGRIIDNRNAQSALTAAQQVCEHADLELDAEAPEEAEVAVE